MKSSNARLGGGPLSSSGSIMTMSGPGPLPKELGRFHRRHPSVLALKDVIGYQKDEINKFTNHHRHLNKEIGA